MIHRHPIRSRLYLIFAVMFGLAACSTPPAAPQFAEIRYTHLPPIRLSVDTVDIRSEATLPIEPPHVEHLMPVSLDAVARQWARDRLTATGFGDLTARFVVTEASVVEERLAVEGGVAGAFRTDVSEAFTARITARLTVLDRQGREQGSAHATAWRRVEVLENATLNERETVWFGLIEGVMQTFDEKMGAAIRANLGGYTLG